MSYGSKLFCFVLFCCHNMMLSAHTDLMLENDALHPSHWGVIVVDLDTGKTLVDHNSEKLFTPASLTKLFTTAAALEIFGEEHRFFTSVFGSTAYPHLPKDTWKGNLVLHGRGDPTLSTQSLQQLAQNIYDLGIRRIEGSLFADDSTFGYPKRNPHAEWEDLVWYFAAEVSALSCNDNAIKMTVKPGAAPGKMASITLDQEVPYCKIINRVYTVEHVDEDCIHQLQNKQILSINARREHADNTFTITGQIATHDSPIITYMSVHQPAEYARQIFEKKLKDLGITISPSQENTRPPERYLELTSLESPPLKEIVALTNKQSHNLSAELFIHAMGKERHPKKDATYLFGLKERTHFLEKIGSDLNDLILNCGSGLSKRNLITPGETIHLLKKMRDNDSFKNSLSIAGVDGSLKQRFKETICEGTLFAKTGGLTHTHCLAGYAQTQSGKQVAFCICVNNAAIEAKTCTDALDALLIKLLDEN